MQPVNSALKIRKKAVKHLKSAKHNNSVEEQTRNPHLAVSKKEQSKIFQQNETRSLTQQSNSIIRRASDKKSQLQHIGSQKVFQKTLLEEIGKSNLKKNKYSSSKNLKSTQPKVHSTFFSPSGNKISPFKYLQNSLSKPTLKKVGKNDLRLHQKHQNKNSNYNKITPFQVCIKSLEKQPDDSSKSLKKKNKDQHQNKAKNSLRRQSSEKHVLKKLLSTDADQKRHQKQNKGSKQQMRTLQNQSLKTGQHKKHRISSSKRLNRSGFNTNLKSQANFKAHTLKVTNDIAEKPSKTLDGPSNGSKLYHKYKMKTQHSFMSCQSTPSEIFHNDGLELLEIIGQGTFGKVYKAIMKKNNQTVAIKRVYQDKKYKNRQLQIIGMLDPKNSYITQVIGTYTTYEENDKEYLNIVMDYYETDLYKVIASTNEQIPTQEQKQATNFSQLKQSKALDPLTIKLYLYQILRGLMYLHSLKICHRDIKPHNILINPNNQELVLCDLGSAKILKTQEQNLPYICSRCYRAPQLIFGSTQYTFMIDLWSVGCVILEIINKTPLFIGNSSIDHLIEIIKVLGTPTKTQVKEMNSSYDLNDYKFPNIKKKSFSKLFPREDPLLISLLEQIMIYAPKERLNAGEALAHEYFDELRLEQVYTRLKSKYGFSSDLFTFKRSELEGNQHLSTQLIPEWYQSKNQIDFEQETIDRTDPFQYYC